MRRFTPRREGEIRRFGVHHNAFGFIRLLFASLVIVSHTSELLDGNRSREVLTRIFRTMSFGDLAVDGFFLLSGILIFGSYIKDPTPTVFLSKRIARIFPGFIFASLICVLIVAPLAGAHVFDLKSTALPSLGRFITLNPPVVRNVFMGTHYPQLDGPMWTIKIEFQCYLLVLALGLTGIIRRRFAIIFGSLFSLALYQILIHKFDVDNQHLRLFGLFLAGGSYYLIKENIDFRLNFAAISFVLLCVFMFIKILAEPSFAVLGGYAIFTLGMLGGGSILAKINNTTDISYGLYLYAWPVEKLILWYWPAATPLPAGVLTFAGAALCGWISWRAVERPAMRFVENQRWLAKAEKAAIETARQKWRTLATPT